MVQATNDKSEKQSFTTICRIDTPIEINYYRNGGILHMILRNMMQE